MFAARTFEPVGGPEALAGQQEGGRRVLCRAVFGSVVVVSSRLLQLATGALGLARVRSLDRSRQVEQRRILHDTALATLTAIATGALDSRADDVRARCARDAAYLRLLVQGGRLDEAGPAATLAEAARDAVGMGLRVHSRLAPLPTDLDPAVVTAVAMAAREALNNVQRHAGTGEAWLTAAAEDRRVVVRVVDRGAGFRHPAPGGSGVQNSILARMLDVGGSARIESTPGEGTLVELTWPG